jgi:hypothetical protein
MNSYLTKRETSRNTQTPIYYTQNLRFILGFLVSKDGFFPTVELTFMLVSRFQPDMASTIRPWL